MTLERRIDRFLWPYLCRMWVYVTSTISLIVGPFLIDICADDNMSRIEFEARLLLSLAMMCGALGIVNSRARYVEWKYRSRWRSS